MVNTAKCKKKEEKNPFLMTYGSFVDIDSTMARSGRWTALLREDLAPRSAWMADLMREEVRRHLNQQSTAL